MTVRIAIVGSPDPANPDHRAIDAALASLGPGIEAPWLTPAQLDVITAADGIWLTPDLDRAGLDTAYAMTAVARQLGAPLLAPAPGQDPFEATGQLQRPVTAFVAAAQYRAWARESGLAGQNLAAPNLAGRPLAGPNLGGQNLAGRTPAGANLGEQNWVAEQSRVAELAREEAAPRPYVHQLRGPRMRWWRPPLALVVFVLTFFGLMTLLVVPFALNGSISMDVEELDLSPATNLWLNLSLAALIPATLLATWLAFRRPPGLVFAIGGRVRWRWLMLAIATVTPLWVAYLAISWYASGAVATPAPRDWLGLAVVTAVTTPLQAAGEEVAFRGALVQWLGAWFRSPVVAGVVTTVVSTGLFVLAHGSLDPWIMIDIGSLGVAACVLTWRTGGLEAAIAIHVINNLLITFSGIAFGGLEQSYVDQTSTGDPISALTSVVAMTAATVLLLWQARRQGLTPPTRTAAAVG